MLTMTATLVSAQDIADVRRWAGEVGELATDRFTTQRVAATLAALDWVEGETVTAPVSGDVLVATPANIDRETVAAGDREDEAQRAGDDDAMAWPGAVLAVLQWVLGRGDSPF